MPMTITLKNIPDDIYASLKSAAEANHRSLNSEVIACLERVLLPARISPEAHLAQARRIRDELKGRKFRAKKIRKIIAQGRP
ncbi:MAG: Arc family DNA-binding protein [Gammaproteobacteria bacterium]|nr:Arc family DNA-binding protein [Gammaproteobacteria bacterium]